MKTWVFAWVAASMLAGCAPPMPRAARLVGYEVFNHNPREIASIQMRDCAGGAWAPVPASVVGAWQRFAIPTGEQARCVDLQALDTRGAVMAEQLHVTLTTGSIWTIE